jgi:3-hydroxyacyl-CoA dehydrogenase/enoyl-CoA hydratase/3-hydroxybutyryl-CoA epimerase
MAKAGKVPLMNRAAAATQRARAVLKPGTIFASNTSTLPITSLAQAYAEPENFIGIHFFSPVEKMLLVEVILGEKTGDLALATALDYVRAIKKTPIVVHDSRGFYANRCVGNYIHEGHIMLLEGILPAMIENVAKMAGMPVGPLALNDEVALDLALKIIEATKRDLGPAAIDPAQENLLKTMVTDHGRFGRKNGKGFYDYPAQATKTLWPGLDAFQPTKRDPDTIDVAELKQRFLVTQAVEAARVIEEGVVTDPREADVGKRLEPAGECGRVDLKQALAGDVGRHGDRDPLVRMILDIAVPQLVLDAERQWTRGKSRLLNFLQHVRTLLSEKMARVYQTHAIIARFRAR